MIKGYTEDTIDTTYKVSIEGDAVSQGGDKVQLCMLVEILAGEQL